MFYAFEQDARIARLQLCDQLREYSVKNGTSPEVMRLLISLDIEPDPTEGGPYGDSHAWALIALTDYARDMLGYQVDFLPHDEMPDQVQGARGATVTEVRKIWIALAPTNAMVRTLVHEMTHALGLTDRAHPSATEGATEAVTFIVCQAIGLDTSEVSVPYIMLSGPGSQFAVTDTKTDQIESIARILIDALQRS